MRAPCRRAARSRSPSRDSGDAAAAWSVRIFVGAARRAHAPRLRASLHVAGVGASVRTSSIDEWSSNSASVAFYVDESRRASAVLLPLVSKAVARVPLPNE